MNINCKYLPYFMLRKQKSIFALNENMLDVTYLLTAFYYLRYISDNNFHLYYDYCEWRYSYEFNFTIK